MTSLAAASFVRKYHMACSTLSTLRWPIAAGSLDGSAGPVSGSATCPVRHREGDGPAPGKYRLTPGGTVYDPDGFTLRSWSARWCRSSMQGSPITPMSFGLEFFSGRTWHLATDVVPAPPRTSWMPKMRCSFIANGVQLVAEGGQHALQRRRHPSLPRSKGAVRPGKAANAGGLPPRLEMSQNAQRLLDPSEVDARLKGS